jgi:hypothetical protein
MGKSAIVKGPGGGLPGGGRTPKALQMQNYKKVIKLLDDNAEEAINVLIDGLTDDDKYYRFNCACVLLKKIIPDKKPPKESGIDIDIENFNVNINNIDNRRADILNMVDMLDSMGFDEMKKRLDNGSERVFNAEFRTEEGEEETMDDREDLTGTGEEQGCGNSESEGIESPICAEEEL